MGWGGRWCPEGGRGRGSGERVPVAGVRRPPPVAARRPVDRRSPWSPPVRPPTAGHAPLLSCPPRPAPRRPARRARVWGRKPARPRPWPRSRGCVPRAVTRGTPRRRPPVARLPPVRGRAVPCRGPALGFRVGAGWCRRRRCRRRVRVRVSRGVRACVRAASARPRPRLVLLPPVVPLLRRGGRGAVGRGSLSPLPSPGPTPPPLRDATSDQTWRPAEFKHISQRRKRN